MKKKKRSDQVGHQNGNIKYTSILIIITFFSMSCSSIKRNIDYDDVEAIKFWYISKYIETDIPITNCANIVYDTLINKDTIITDRIVIEKYITEINRLKPVNKHINYDLRVASAIKFKEGKQENMGICISLLNSVVLKDDVIMQSDKRLIELLDEILYNHLTDKDWTLPFMLEDDEE